MGATEILKYIVFGAGIISGIFGAVAAFFAYRYRAEIRQAEIHRAQKSRRRVLEQQTPLSSQNREAEREPAHVG